MAFAKVCARRMMLAAAVIAAGCLASSIAYAGASVAYDLGSYVGSR